MKDNSKHLTDLRLHWSKAPNEELLEIAKWGYEDYTTETKEIIETELIRRGLNDQAIKVAQDLKIERKRENGWDADETLLGGMSSPHLFKGVISGYAIFLTNKRIIGIKKPSEGFKFGASIMPGLIGALSRGKGTGTFFSENEENYPNISNEVIDFEIPYSEIKKIEIKKSPSSFKPGNMKICVEKNEDVEIKIRRLGENGVIKCLMEIFKTKQIVVV